MLWICVPKKNIHFPSTWPWCPCQRHKWPENGPRRQGGFFLSKDIKQPIHITKNINPIRLLRSKELSKHANNFYFSGWVSLFLQTHIFPFGKRDSTNCTLHHSFFLSRQLGFDEGKRSNVSEKKTKIRYSRKASSQATCLRTSRCAHQKSTISGLRCNVY